MPWAGTGLGHAHKRRHSLWSGGVPRGDDAVRVGRDWFVLREVVVKCPKSVPGTKEEGLPLRQALDFFNGAEGDRTPDLMTASR
jgi:hypothetical protein